MNVTGLGTGNNATDYNPNQRSPSSRKQNAPLPEPETAVDADVYDEQAMPEVGGQVNVLA